MAVKRARSSLFPGQKTLVPLPARREPESQVPGTFFPTGPQAEDFLDAVKGKSTGDGIQPFANMPYPSTPKGQWQFVKPRAVAGIRRRSPSALHFPSEGP